jgi:aspartate racemase
MYQGHVTMTTSVGVGAAVMATKRIGILGGSSDQATADYYRRLNETTNKRYGGWNTAELIVTSMNFAFSADCVRNGRWDDMAAYLADRAVTLEKGGADFYLWVSNTLHRVADQFAGAVSIPFLHIVDPTALAIRDAGLKNVALLGTKPMMSTDHVKRRYTEKFGIEIMVPEPSEQDRVDTIIFDDLCRGRFTAPAKFEYLEIADRPRARGAEGLILGCTEIPLQIEQVDRPSFPMFDTTGLHVDAAVEMASGVD